jgi:hypothetical protein
MVDREPKVSDGNNPIDIYERAEVIVGHMDGALKEAVEIVAPGQDLDVQDVFVLPSEKRDEDPGLDLTSDQESSLREVAATLGWGRKQDKTPTEQGLTHGWTAVVEGGQPHKVRAELELTAEGNPGLIVVATSANRRITADAERASGAQIAGIDVHEVGATEFEVIEQVVGTTSGFEPTDEEVLPVSYEVQPGHAIGQERSGQLRRIGRLAGADVILLRVDREEYIDDEGVNKYNQPGAAEVMIVVDAMLAATQNDSPIGFVTSSTYEPSRTVDAVRVGLSTGRQAEVVAYGTERLAAVRGTEPVDGPINQLPGELRKAADNLERLRQLLQ